MTESERKREYNKQRLKKNLIDSDAEVRVEKTRHPLLIVFIAAIMAGLIAAAIWYAGQVSSCPVNYSTVWEKELPGTGASLTFKGNIRFGNGLITYTKDGAEYTDGDGATVWQKSYQMNSPVCCVNGDYAVITDLGGTTGCIFSNTECTGNITSILPISEAKVSGKGVVFTVENDDGADFINVYRKDGSALDISVKSVTDGDGYPFSIAASPSGSQLAASYIGFADGSITQSVVFRNFGDVGQNDARRVVGGFIDEFNGHIVTRVSFPTETCALAYYDGGVVIFSTKVLNSPEIVKNISFEDEMLSVCDCSAGFAVVFADTQGEYPKRLEIYDLSGSLKGSAGFDLSYDNVSMSSQNVIVNSQDHILAFTLKGRPAADLSYNGRILYAAGTSRLREFIISESGHLSRIKAE